VGVSWPSELPVRIGGEDDVDMDYDAELRLYDEVLGAAWGVGAGDQVLDVGCGAGRTTRQVARLAVGGSALGVDVLAPAVARARRLAQNEGLRNVAFECADAQVHRFQEGRFDLAISRFGTMFFGDPVAAFGNIGRALRADGRLVMIVWQAEAQNEWAVEVDRIVGAGDDPAAPDPFSLGDPTTTTAILEAAGFAGVAVTDVRRPVYYGPDADAALAWVGGFTSTKNALERLDDAGAADTLGRLRGLMAEHLSGDGVWFDSGAWIVTARVRGCPRAGSGRAGSRSGP
jgi:SAM-dependent methyltransferase